MKRLVYYKDDRNSKRKFRNCAHWEFWCAKMVATIRHRQKKIFGIKKTKTT